jgi:two-component system, NtrC family, sensor kinase
MNRRRKSSSSELSPVLGPGPASLRSPSLSEVLAELLSLTRSVSVEMHDEEIVHAYVGALQRLFPGRLFTVRLFDAGSGGLSLVYATGRLLPQRRERVSISTEALADQGISGSVLHASIEIVDDYVGQFDVGAAGFDIAVGDGRTLFGVLAVEYGPDVALLDPDRARMGPVALQLSASLKNARLLRESLYLRDYLTKLLEHANAPILVIGQKREIRVVNRALLSLTGFRREEVVGRDFLSLIDADERGRIMPVLIAALRGQSATGVEVRVPSRRGGPVRLLMNTASVLSADGEVEGVIAIGRDLTEIRELEQRIVHAERLASVGQLAAGVVHELNNPLTSISVYSEYLLKQAERDGSTRADTLKLRRIHESADRILKFSRELLAYARPSVEEPRITYVGDVIERSLEYCDYVIQQRGVSVSAHVADDVPPVLGVSGQLQQVLVNLITNACHAMPEGAGMLTVDARASASGDVELRVSDNGSGISPDHLSRIFEPFFSTKGEGHGTGLGLSIVRNLVEIHHGLIEVHSDLGQGTTFVLTFPAQPVAHESKPVPP